MKTIGLIGGMSWESSAVYYEYVNRAVQARLGGFHSCRCLLLSVDFAEVERLQHAGDWAALDELMGDAARRLELAGAELIVLCTNTMHLCQEAIRARTSIPFLHIAEATAREIERAGLSTVGLLGTRFTMEKDFYKEVLREWGIEVIIPDAGDREVVHRIIYQELVHGKIETASREMYCQVIGRLAARGAEGIVLGCTEIPLLVSTKDVTVPVFDTTRIHAERAVEWALG